VAGDEANPQRTNLGQAPHSGQTHAVQPRPVQPRSRGFFGSQIGMLLVTAFVVALLGLGSVPWFLSDPARLSRLIAQTVPDLQADVRIDRARIGWTGPIVLEGVRIVPRDGSAAPLSIRRIEGSHGLVAMLVSAGDLGRIRLEGVEGNLAFAADRTSNLASLFAPDVDDSATRAARGPRRSPLRLRLETDDAVLRITGPWTVEPWVSDPIRLRAALGPAADGLHSEWTLEPVDVFNDAIMEPGVAQGVLAYIAPVIADATRTAGRFSLHLDAARLPVGRPEAGTLSGTLSMHEVVLGPGPLVSRVFASLPGRLPPPPTVLFAEDARVQFMLADERVWHRGLEFGLPLAKPGQRLDVESSGSVGLVDGSLDVVLKLPIPADLPQDRPLLAALSGKTISVGIGGELGAPQVKFDGSIKQAAGEVVSDLLGNVLDEVKRRRAERRAFEPAVPGPVPVPGRGGLFRRFGPPR
jgi:hypothetical protein